MKIPPRNLDAFVKKPSPDALAILVYGPDEGLVRERIKLLTQNTVADPQDPFSVVDIPAERHSDAPTLLLDEAQSISMLGGQRVVRVRGDVGKAGNAIVNAVKALKDGDNLVLIEAGPLSPRSPVRAHFETAKNAAALPCYVDDSRDISRVISQELREQGYRIAPDALELMADSVVGDRAVARGEVEKLITYMGAANTNIALADVVAAVGDSGVRQMDDLCTHTASGRFAEADTILTTLLSEDTNAVLILRALQNYFMRLHIARARLDKGESADDAMKKLKPPVFWKQKEGFERQLHELDAAKLEKALSVLAGA